MSVLSISCKIRSCSVIHSTDSFSAMLLVIITVASGDSDTAGKRDGGTGKYRTRSIKGVTLPVCDVVVTALS